MSTTVLGEGQEVKMSEENKPATAKALLLDKIAYRLVLALVFLTPFFFIPYPGFPLQLAKGVLVFGLSLAAFILWLIARLREGRLAMPAPALQIAGLSVVIATVISALGSGAWRVSLIGLSAEIGTAASIVSLFILLLLIVYFFRSKSRVFYTYLAILASFAVVAVYTFLRFVFGGSFLSFGYFEDVVANLVGKWNDLGVFFGVTTLLSLLSLELISLSAFWRGILYVCLVLSLGFLAVVNFNTLWVVLGVFSLLLGVYLVVTNYRKVKQPASLSEGGDASNGQAPSRRQRPFVTLVVFVISLLFILFGRSIGDFVSTQLQVFQVESRPSWRTTGMIAKETFKTDPVLGAGPNRFVSKWLLHKPKDVNSSIFWGVDFNFGIGLLPTFVISTGLLGLICWLFFLVLFLKLGLRTLTTRIADPFSRYLAISSFTVSLFLWVIAIIYVPTTAVIALTFIFTGLFMAIAAEVVLARVKDFSFADNPKAGLTGVVALIALLIVSIVLLYGIAVRFAGALSFQKALGAFAGEGNISKAELGLRKAADFSPNDLIYRSLSEVGLVKINQLLIGQNNLSADELRNKFLSLFGETLNFAKRAVEFDATNYQNHVALGRIYEAIVPLRVEGAYQNAAVAYGEALKRNPHSPALYLILARLETAKGDTKKAREYIGKAREEKSNYTEAVFFLSQLEAADGNVREAIKQADAAALLAPNDPVVSFQLGLLKYSSRDYRGAAGALERAVGLNPVYANARYFLGLSYSNLGQTKDAISQFEEVQKTNPDNAEVKLILANLRAGRPPFADAVPPVDDKPEKRSSLPLPDDRGQER